eukprot:SM000170S02672  [mRNA]  locus=s170:183759:186436:+ [translate_table: standard]
MISGAGNGGDAGDGGPDLEQRRRQPWCGLNGQAPSERPPSMGGSVGFNGRRGAGTDSSGSSAGTEPSSNSLAATAGLRWASGRPRIGARPRPPPRQPPPAAAAASAPVVLLDDDDDGDGSGGARQLAADEELARRLQEQFEAEVLLADSDAEAAADAALARTLQAEENARAYAAAQEVAAAAAASAAAAGMTGEAGNQELPDALFDHTFRPGGATSTGERERQLRRQAALATTAAASLQQGRSGEGPPYRASRRLPQTARRGGRGGSWARSGRRFRVWTPSAVAAMAGHEEAGDGSRMTFVPAREDASSHSDHTHGAHGVQRMEFLAAMEAAMRRQLPLAIQLAALDRDFNEQRRGGRGDYEMLLALDDVGGRGASGGASRRAIESLPTNVVMAQDATAAALEPCPICLDVPAVGDELRRLPCLHVFHRECIDDWLGRQALCPICKAHI